MNIFSFEERQPFIVRPVIIDFGQTKEHGVLATDGTIKTYVYPISNSIFEQSPVKGLHEAILRGGVVFKDLMRRAYEQKAKVHINDDTVVHWDEYESLFAKCSFYSPVVAQGEIDEDWHRAL